MKIFSKGLDTFSFREEQKKAILATQKYLEAFSTRQTSQSSLVCMPTGSGKTGVFAYLSRFYKSAKNPIVLILSPRIKITEQAYHECFNQFFNKLDKSVAQDKLPKSGALYLKKVDNIVTIKSETVCFMTIQKLVNIWKPCQNINKQGKNNRKRIFQFLLKNTGLVIIDEGHYEPAQTWSACIREFKQCPKLIFTATPYRNDLKAFNISNDHIFFSSYKTSLNQNNVREIKVIDSPEDVDEEKFIEEVVLKFQEYKNRGKILDSGKLIVRCDDKNKIQRMADWLENKKIQFRAIHEGFKKSEKKNQVALAPKDIQNSSIDIWLHQYKLMEGVDAPSFQFLAIYDNFSNSRALVQQIGRVIRRMNNRDHTAYVMDNLGGQTQTQWKAYKAFDEYIDKNPEKLFLHDKDYFEKSISCHPDFVYLLSNFREVFSFKKVNVSDDIQLPLTCNVYKFKENGDFSTLSSSAKKLLKEKDRINHLYKTCENSFCIIHYGFSQNKYLKNKVFLQNDLEVIFVKRLGKYVFIYDKTGIVVRYLQEKDLIEPIAEKKLRKLYNKKDPNSFISSVSLRNTNLNKNTIRQKSILARQISDTIISVDDFSQICTQSTGFSFEEKKRIKRSIGYSNGKVTQDSRYLYTLADYSLWLDSLEKVFDSNRGAIQVFSRYADEKPPKPDLKASNILLDLSHVDTNFTYLENKEIFFEDTCCDIDASGNFQIIVSNKKYQLTISHPCSGRYSIGSDELEKDFKPIEGARYSSIIKSINELQSFTILYDNSNIVYSFGQYFEPEIKVGKSFDNSQFEVLSLLEPYNYLGKQLTEKGENCETDGSNWGKDSLFRLISDLGEGTNLSDTFGSKEDIQFLICDDLGTEIADFILATENKVVFIHAKAKKNGSNVSASGLTEVCGQATKNVYYISPFNKIKPAGVAKWKSEWSAKEGKVKDRIRIPKCDRNDPKKIWDDISKKIRNPNIEREVWLLLGNILSKKELDKKLRSNNDNKIALQVSLQLMSCYQAIYASGAKLRVMCKP